MYVVIVKFFYEQIHVLSYNENWYLGYDMLLAIIGQFEKAACIFLWIAFIMRDLIWNSLSFYVCSGGMSQHHNEMIPLAITHHPSYDLLVHKIDYSNAV